MSSSPLVIFPPIATDPADLAAAQLERVEPQPSSVSVYRYPGHEGAPRRPGVTFRMIADEVAQELESSSDRADVVGIGMGAYIVAELLLHHPQRVRSAVVMSSPITPVPDASRERDRELGRSAAAGMSDIVEPTLARWFTPWAIGSALGGVGIARHRLNELDPEVWNDLWIAISERSALDDTAAAGVRQPVTVVAPIHDPSPNPARLRELASALPLSRLMFVDGPHMVHLERPEVVLAAVDSHLAWTAALPEPVEALYWVGK